jgi:eukaryotic-like serine/threonine-protein kinase
VAEAAAHLRLQGLVLGRYRPLTPLGSGGSGSVWLARDEAAGIDVALKIVAREGKAAARAEREAAAAARLRHERCLRAYALAHDEGHVYIAYEYVPGRTMREALRAGELDDRGSVEAAVQILDGLAHAHARGIVHRDVKPSNVLLADGEGVSVRLLDFGLARMDEADTLTAMGDVPGTLAYISPERLGGQQATAASDVWAVGVLLWEALAGVHPFWKPSLLESARAIGSGAASLASMRPDLPKPLVAAVDRALSLDPGRRPSAAKLASALRGSLEHRSQRGRRENPLSGPARRLAPAALAALVAGWSAFALPFYPEGAAPALAAIAAAAAIAWPRLGLALALAVPILPLGNESLAVALLYTGVALLWALLFARESRGGLLFALGALLAPVAALGLIPLAVQSLRSPVRRAAAAAAAVAVAAIVAGVRGSALPFTGKPLETALALGGSDDPVAVAGAFWHVLAQHPSLGWEAIALAAGAVALPYAHARGLWAVAGFGAALLALMLLPAPGVPALPLVLAVWTTCTVLAASARSELPRRNAS